MYPKWKPIVGSVIFYSSIKYATEMSEYLNKTPTEKDEWIALVLLGSLVNGLIILMFCYFRFKDIKLLKQVQELTLTDSLTGFYNRRYFDLFMEKAIPAGESDSLVLIMVDIDSFKKINDQNGHQCGDEALKHISEVIKLNVRKSDAAVRFGGDEFAIVLPNTTLDEGKTIAERICEEVAKSKLTYKNTIIHCTVCLGLALYHTEDTVEELIVKADKALYQSKKNGGNLVGVFDE